MPTRLGLVSDVHASPVPLREALCWFAEQNVDRILCAGDIAGYYEELDETVRLLRCNEVESIAGNHDTAWLEQHAQDHGDTASYLRRLPASLHYELEGLQIDMLHAEPPDREHGGIKLLDVEGRVIDERRDEWSAKLCGESGDIMIVGHTHQVFAEMLGDVLVINPGSSVFNHSIALLELPSKRVEFHALGGTDILKSWNFSMLRRSGDPYPPAKK